MRGQGSEFVAMKKQELLGKEFIQVQISDPQQLQPNQFVIRDVPVDPSRFGGEQIPEITWWS